MSMQLDDRLTRILGNEPPSRAKNAGARKGGESAGFNHLKRRSVWRIPVGDWRNEERREMA